MFPSRTALFGTGLAAAALAWGLSGAPGAAHPHIYIDGGADLVFDAQGRLAALRITWIYDPLTSLFMSEELGLPEDPHTPLSDADRARLAAYQTEWQPEFEGDSYLYDGDRSVPLSGPLEPDAEMRGGQAVIRFLRRVEAPFHPDPDARIEIYDPTYYTAYTITETPQLEGNAKGCAADVEPYRPNGQLAALQQSLFALPADEDPEQNLGALFADKIYISCASSR